MSELGNLNTALSYFYQTGLDEFDGMPMNAMTFVDRVGNKGSMDFIKFLEIVGLKTDDKVRADAIEVVLRSNILFKDYTPIKYRDIRKKVCMEIFFSRTTKMNILNIFRFFWEKETKRKKDKYMEISIDDEKISRLFNPISTEALVYILEMDDLLLFGDKLKINIPRKYIITDVEVV